MHENQLLVTVEMARDLISAQFPELASMAVASYESIGTDNAIFRIGSRLAARFRLRPGTVEEVHRALLEEANAGRELLGATRVPIPEPVGIGEPGAGYPLPWSIQTWIPGVTAYEDPPAASAAFARDLAAFIGEVRAIEVGSRRFSGKGRGGDLRSHDRWMGVCFDRSEELLDVPLLRRIWARLRVLPREAPDRMTHGDLIPANVLVHGGRLAGILDVGGLGPRDPAVDLVGAWHLLDAENRLVLRRELGCDDLEWERGKAWAFEQAMGLAWYYRVSNPSLSRTGRMTLDRIVTDET